MTINIIIEMPKGDDRRRHLAFDKSGIIDLGLIKDKIPVNDGIMPVDYGYIPGTKNQIEEDELDVLLISSRIFKAGDAMEAHPIALLVRDDGDDKIVAVDSDSTCKEWNDLPESTQKIILEFFGHNHAFIRIEPAESTVKYIEERSL